MPIATPEQFRQMLDAAQEGGYAYPAINVTSIMTLNAAMKGFAESKSDGIIQFSTGAGQFASGLQNKDAAFGCIVLAEAAHRLAERFDVLMALNTDRLGQGVEHVLCNRACVLGRPKILQQDHELITAQPGDGITLTDPLGQPCGTNSQQVVADRMAERIVDVLEAIEIEKQHRQASAFAVGTMDRVLDPVTQQ